MKTAAVGDTLLLAGFPNDIRVAYPEASLTLITGADNSGAAELMRDAFDRLASVSPRSLASSIRTLRRLELDVLIDFGSWPRFDAILAALSGAHFTVGFRTGGQYRHFAYDATVEHSGRVHERENYARLLTAIGVVASSPASLQPPRLVRAEPLFAEPYAVFHPWSAGYMRQAKEWPVQHWIELARWLSANGIQIIISGGPANRAESGALAQDIIRSGVTATSIAGRFSLTELADILVSSEVVVTVNTGIAHLAGLVGARTVSLEGPTPVARWRPLGPRVRTVSSAFEGCGFLNLGFEYSGQRLDCMDGVYVEAVVAAIGQLRGVEGA